VAGRPLGPIRPGGIAVALLLSAAPAARTQQPNWSGIPAVDSASAARSAWRDAGRALRAGDTVAAGQAVSRAASAWPTQPGYLMGRAQLSALLGDDAALADALRRLARLEAGAALLSDSAVASRAAMSPAVRAAREDLERRTAPRAGSTPFATIPDTTVWAEGVDADPRTGRLYVGSIRHRTVLELGTGGRVRDLGLGRDSRVGSVMGVRVDPRGGVVWVTTVGLPQMEGFAPADTTIAALLRVRIADGVIERRWDLPAEAAGHVPGDLAIGPRGDVFVTDSRAPVVYRLRLGADTLERLTHPLFHSLQGVAVTPDGAALYVADYSHGLLRVDLATGTAQRLEDAPGTTSLGLDGIVFYRGAIVGVQNGVSPPRIARFTLSADGRRIVRAEVLDRNLPLADEPTIGTLLGDAFVYVANSQWEKYDDDGRRRPGTALAPTVLLSLRLQ